MGDYFLKFDGCDGDATAAGYEGQIPVESFSTGVSRNIHTGAGRGKNRESTAAVCHDLTCRVLMDKAYPLLFAEACTGIGKTAKLTICQTHEGKLEKYADFTLTNALISNMSVDGDGDTPMLTVSFNATKYETSYISFDQGHNAGGPVMAGYDVELGQKV